MALFRSSIHTIYYLKADFMAYLMLEMHKNQYIDAHRVGQ